MYLKFGLMVYIVKGYQPFRIDLGLLEHMFFSVKLNIYSQNGLKVLLICFKSEALCEFVSLHYET